MAVNETVHRDKTTQKVANIEAKFTNAEAHAPNACPRRSAQISEEGGWLRNPRICMNKVENHNGGSRLVPRSIKAKGKRFLRRGGRYIGSLRIRAKSKRVANSGLTLDFSIIAMDHSHRERSLKDQDSLS